MMNTTRWRHAVPAALLLASAACSGGEATEAEAAAASAPRARVVNVEVAEIGTEPFTSYVEVVGTVQASRDVTVSAEEAGVVREVYVDRGSYVKAGQPLAKIDDRILRAQADQATAQARLAAEQHERQRRLWEEEKIGSEMAYLNAKYGAETAAAGARVLRERLERTVVRAPITGYVEDRMIEVGASVAPGAPVARIVDLSTVKVTGGVPERYAGQVERGGETTVAFDALGGEGRTGTIRFVGSAVDAGNRTFPVEVAIANAGERIKPGMIARVRIARGGTREAVVVPQEAVLRDQNGYVVYVATTKSGAPVAEARPVTLGPAQQNRVVVEQGLQPGEQVIIVGQNKVAAGDRLKIVGGER